MKIRPSNPISSAIHGVVIKPNNDLTLPHADVNDGANE